MIPDIVQYCIECIRKTGLQEKARAFRKRELILKDHGGYNIPCILVTLHDLRQVIIWDLSRETTLHDEIKNILFIHLINSGSTAGYFFLNNAIFQVMNTSEPDIQFCADIKPLSDAFCNDRVYEEPSFSERLDRYLDTVYRSVSRVFYQTYGEGERDKREYFVLSGILKIFFVKMLYESGIEYSGISDDSYIWHLITFGTTIPGYPDDEPIQCQDPVFTRMVDEGCRIQVPESVRFHLIDPIIAIRAFCRLMNRITGKGKVRTEQRNYEDALPSLISSPVFSHVIRSILAYEEQPAIIDPISGTGELILLLLRMYHNPDRSPLDRLQWIAHSVFCQDPSFSNVLLTRFGLILYVIDGEFLHPALFASYHGEWLPAIRSHIRVGNTLFNREIVDEYLSKQEAQSAFYHLRPADSEWPACPLSRSVVLVTAPYIQSDCTDQERCQYLWKHYSSYSHDARWALYFAEYIIKRLSYNSYIFLPSSWISEQHAGPFRKMIKESRISRIIFEEDDQDRRKPDGWSCLHAQEYQSSIEIIRIAENGSITAYQVKQEDLPEHDGWNFEDPFGKDILNALMRDTITLSEYCLGATYRPSDLAGMEGGGVWISIRIISDRLMVTAGDTPEQNADLIIKGPDEYLEGVLSSPLMRWYCTYVRRAGRFTRSDLLISALPIHQPDWYSPEEKEYVRLITDSLHERTFLMEKTGYARSYHDQDRLFKRLIQIEERIHTGVCRLYHIPPSLQDLLLYRDREQFHLYRR